MPNRSGISHVLAAIVVILIGPFLREFISMLVTGYDILHAIQRLGETVATHPFIPAGGELIATIFAIIVVIILSFIWGYAYHVLGQSKQHSDTSHEWFGQTPSQSGISHVIAATIVIMVGPFLREFTLLFARYGDFQHPVQRMIESIIAHPFLPINGETTATFLSIIIILLLAFIWGYSYHILSYDGRLQNPSYKRFGE